MDEKTSQIQQGVGRSSRALFREIYLRDKKIWICWNMNYRQRRNNFDDNVDI